MFRWVPYAMVRIAGFFIAGVLLGIYRPDLIAIKLSTWTLLALLVSYFLYFAFQRRKRLNPIIGIMGLFTVGLAGYVHVQTYTESGDADHLLSYQGNVNFFTAEIGKPPEEKENSWKYEIQLKKVSDGDQWKNLNAKLLLYVNKAEGQAIYNYGDHVLVRGSPNLLSPPQNPHEFDFKRFLSFKNIYHQFFAKAGQVEFIGPTSERGIQYYSYKVRSWTAARLKEYLPDKQEQAIALALTLGVTDGIDNELQNAYSASGAMHVLAVSGLHVGIIYGIVLLLFRPFRNLAWSRWMVALVSIIILWSFAFITGLSPSVLRAVTMFTFIAAAKPFGRGTSIYNTLAASAFLLLLFNPYLIMSVGFQLSYLAVLGIVTLHRPLYLLWEPRHKFWDWIWNISCVSLAAQLATFLLGLLYFHQFPLYFLISNLFVIPGATLILVTSILLVALSFIPIIASGIGFVLHGMIQFLNFTVFTTERLPFSLIENIYLTTAQCWFLMGALLFFILLLQQKKFNYLIASLSFVCCFSVSQWLHFKEEINREQMVVYNIARHTGIDFINRGASQFYGDHLLTADTAGMHFHIQPNRLFDGVDQTAINTRIVDDNQPVHVVRVGNKRVALIASPINHWPKELQVDYVVLSNNALKSLAEIKELVNFEKLILDTSNSMWLCDKIQKETKHELVYSVGYQGAYVENF